MLCSLLVWLVSLLSVDAIKSILVLEEKGLLRQTLFFFLSALIFSSHTYLFSS